MCEREFLRAFVYVCLCVSELSVCVFVWLGGYLRACVRMCEGFACVFVCVFVFLCVWLCAKFVNRCLYFCVRVRVFFCLRVCV